MLGKRGVFNFVVFRHKELKSLIDRRNHHHNGEAWRVFAYILSFTHFFYKFIPTLSIGGLSNPPLIYNYIFINTFLFNKNKYL